MTDTSMKTLPFRVEASEADNDGKGLFTSVDTGKVIEVSVDTLRTNLNAMTESFLEALKEVRQVGKFKLQEVTIKLEVGAEGGVNFIGSANVKGSGAIELKFVEP